MTETKFLTNTLTPLPRGGYLFQDEDAVIQFGAPPETIKDTMLLPSSVPQYFVLPRKLFHWEKGISLAELEFPIYYNFFFKKKKTHIICRREQAESIMRVLQEAVFGPEILNTTEDFHPTLADSSYLNLRGELNYYKNFEFKDILELHFFKKDSFRLDELSIKIDKNDDFEIYKKGRLLRTIPGGPDYSAKFDIGQRLPEPYKPPLFGITCLGPSHGFDPTENTSGFIIWLNHHGIMIDPPVNSTEWLEDSNVNPKLINSIILTHCHADHDAGTFQKILEEGRITIYTTKTIMGSFLRKYSALSGEPDSYLRRLFNFQPVYIGKPVFINGGQFRMQYSLHSIPTMGFTLRFQEKSFVYSSDHQNSPEVHKELLDKQIITQARYDELSSFPWDSNLIFHESGVPPLHTSVRYLNSLPVEIQKKIFVYHIAKKDFPEDTYLTLSRFGIENTVYLETKSPEFEKTYEILSILKHLDFFQSFPLEKVQEFIMFVKEVHYKEGEFIIRKGSKGEHFYIIGSGNVAVQYENSNRKKRYGIYEYFGEVALLTDQRRTVDIVAETDVCLFTIAKENFLSFISGTEFEDTLKNLITSRDQESWELLSSSKDFKKLTSYQRTWLESMLKAIEVPGEGTLIREGKSCSRIYIIRQGEVIVKRNGNNVALLKRGDIVGALRDLSPHPRAKYTFSHTGPLSLYEIKWEDYSKFIERNPGLLIKLANDF